jgi:outer membrane protein TolC
MKTLRQSLAVILLCLSLAAAANVSAQQPVSTPAFPTSVAQQTPLTLDEALHLSATQASGFQQAALTEKIAAEDVKQAQSAFLPRVTSPLSYIYTSPLLHAPPGTPRGPSFVAANGISEYQGAMTVTGDLDIAGKLRATVARNRALLAAAHAGTEVARRALIQATTESYYGLAMATAQRRAAEENLAAALEFERITSLLLRGGEVAPVDQTRAQLQTTTRRDELERAIANEAVAAGALRALVGYDVTRPITTIDLANETPIAGETERFSADAIATRPELAQFEAEARAANQDLQLARAERRPQLSYTVSGGFDSDSLQGQRFKQHMGTAAMVSLNIPIFDWGASKSREQQARLRSESIANERTQALRGFAQQFEAARTLALSAATRIRLAGTGLALAQSNLNASVARYRAGEAPIIEVTDAQTALVSQRAALYQAIFDYQTARARLRQAAGQ